MAGITFAYAERTHLDEYLAEWTSQHPVNLQRETWLTLWDSIRNSIFAREGIEVGEIGTTWLTRLVGMNAIRPFETGEIDYITGRSPFPAAILKNSQVDGDRHIWSIPWTLDTRAIYYWSDKLEMAGVDSATAFQTPDQLRVTLDLLSSQIKSPWGVTTQRETLTMQNLATWIWQAGSDFVSEDGRKTRFTEHQSLQAIEKFYSLYTYMPQQAAPLDTEEVADLFSQRRVAAVMSGPWFVDRVRERLGESPLLANLHVAAPPGPAFLGGTSLVILAHTPASSVRNAIELIKWLLSKPSQERLSTTFGALPVRSDIISAVATAHDPLAGRHLEIAEKGRSYPSVRRWGLVEERMVDVLSDIWVDLQNTSEPLTDILHKRLIPAARNLDLVLSQ